MNFTFVAGLLEIKWKKSIDIASFLNTRSCDSASAACVSACVLHCKRCVHCCSHKSDGALTYTISQTAHMLSHLQLKSEQKKSQKNSRSVLLRKFWFYIFNLDSRNNNNNKSENLS